MAESGFSRFIPPNLRQPLAEAGALGYQLLDNVVGFEDEYDTTGELLGRSLREDPVGTAGSIASGVVDSVKAAYEDPFGTLSALGDEFVGAYEMLSAPMNLSAGREEVGKRLEAASLLSSVIPVAGVAGAGTKALGGTAADVVDTARRAPDDIFNVEINRLLDEEEVIPDPVAPTPFPFVDFVQEPFVFDEPEFNPNAFDPEEPIDYGDTMPEDFFTGAFEDFDPLPDPVQLHPFDERVLRNPIPLPGTLPASRFPDANPYNTDQGFAYSPLTWPSNEGVAGLYSRAARAAGGLKQPAYGNINQLRGELEARGAPPKELDTQMGYLNRLFEESPTGTVSAEDVQGMLSNAPGIEILRTGEFAPIGPRGGQNYTSTVYTHPAADFGPQQASEHFIIGEDTPPLFHTRAAQYQIAPDGGPATTHHVLEIQSDWAQFRQTLPDTAEKRAEMQAEVDRLSNMPEDAETFQRMERLKRALEAGFLRPEFDGMMPAPLIKNENDWVDAGVRQNLLDAVNSGSDWITFGNGSQAVEHVGMPKAAAERFYDRQVPLSVERVLRKLSREARTEFPELQDVEFVDGQPVKGLRITPELREALIQNGLPSFRDGGMVSDQTSRVGRPLYENPDGSYYSEVTVTFPFEGKWLTFPSVDESGNILSEDEVFDYVKKNGPVDPITGETFPFFETLEDAESFARDRSKGLINFRDGGMVTASEYLLAGRQY